MEQVQETVKPKKIPKAVKSKKFDEMKELFDDESSIAFTGQGEVEIYKIRVRQIPLLVGLFDDVQEHFKKNKKASQKDLVMFLVAHKFQDILPIISSFSSLDEKTFEDMELDDAVIVISSIIRKNKDFLERTLAPLIEKLATLLTQ